MERSWRNYRVHIALAVALMLLGSVRIVSTYNVFNHTIDEPAHLAAGMEWIEGHKYRYEDLHPPLARIFGALGPYLAGFNWNYEWNIWSEGLRLLGRGERYDRVLFLGRLGILPFFWLAGAVVFLWALRIAGPWAAVLAIFFFTTTPPVLAHAGLITTDMALAACVGAAALASLYWVEYPTTTRTIVFGSCLALAILSKFSSLLFLPSAWIAMYLAYLLKNHPGPLQMKDDVSRSVRPASRVLLIAALGIWAGYLFTFHKVEYLNLRLPAPAFFTGLRSLWVRNNQPGISHLLGERSPDGFWNFFPVVLAVKTPLAMLILIAIAAWLTFRFKDRLAMGIPLAFSAGILLSAMMSKINIGSRHVLPLYIGFSIVCGIATTYSLQRAVRWPARATVLVLLAWQFASGFLQHPNYIAYTNEIAGDEPEKILADSDLDWGQDMKRLGRRLQELGAKEVTMAIFNRGYLEAGHPFPKVHEMPPGDTPPPGWNAISLTRWRLNAQPTWPDRIPPQEKIGRSMYLYYFPPKSSGGDHPTSN